jgi:hypothetical protein
MKLSLLTVIWVSAHWLNLQLASDFIANLDNDCSAYLESMRSQFRELVQEIQILKLMLVFHYIS